MNFNQLKYSLLFIFNFNLFLGLPNSFFGQNQVAFLHLGDSHLQPNNLSGMTRYLLQKEIGNAGRGLIFPYVLAKTNGPKDFFFTSDITWKSAWITQQTDQTIGLTGISIQSNSTKGNMSWSTGKDTLRYPASTGMLVFEIKDCQQCTVRVNSSQKQYTNQDKLIDTMVFSIDQPTSKLFFEGATFTLLDLVELSDQNGLVYHSTGVAGATFKNYNDNPQFIKSLALLEADYVIVSLGTNESVKKWDSVAFEMEVNKFIDHVKSSSPTSKLIIVLPNENYLKVNGNYVYNSRLDSVRAVLLSIANKRNLLYYDQQEAMGGKGCMLEWKKQGLVNEDHIHFLKKGYQQQGSLLFEYLTKMIH